MTDLIIDVLLVLFGFCMGNLFMRCILDEDLAKLCSLESHNNMLERDDKENKRVIDRCLEIIDDLSSQQDNEPEECRKGPWCHNCQYKKDYHRRVGNYYSPVDTFYCGKNEACKCLVERKDE